VARAMKKTPAPKSRPKAAAKKAVKAKPAPKRVAAKRPVAAKKQASRYKPKAAPKAVAKKASSKTPPSKAQAGKAPPAKPPAKAPPAKPAAKAAPATKAAAKPVATPAPKPVAPPPKPEPPRKPRKPELTPKEIAGIKTMLLEQRKTFTREFSDLEEGAFNISQSEISGEVSFDEEYADAGSFTFEREKELSIGNNIRDLLDKVDHALAAIERGTYGICENCGNPIAKARLLALPYSTLCLSCKQIDERTR
jgi:RNA polymerase-binding protein DksA